MSSTSVIEVASTGSGGGDIQDLLDFLGAGAAQHFKSTTTTTPGVAQTLISETVPAGKTWYLHTARISSRMDIKWEVKVAGAVAASGRSGAGHPDSPHQWHPAKSVAASTLITVEILSRSGQPVADVEAYLSAAEV